MNKKVLLQITNTETIDSLSTVGGDNDNTVLFLIIGLFLIGLLAYFILRPKKKDKIENKSTESRNQNSRQKVSVTEKSKGRKVDFSKSQTKIKSKELHQTRNTATKEKEQTNKTKQPNNKISPPIKKKEDVIPEKEEQSKEKYIGYKPINIFAQTEPLDYPYVLMPKPNSVIKFPRKGRSGRKSFKEEEFYTYVVKYFKGHFQVFDDRFILVKNSHSPYEPDFTLIDEREGINIFLDVEIDEPYEGLNDIEKRKPTHFQNFDINRNNAFKNRGWIVIRFAEIQVHQEPDSCCRFIADVLKSINPKYNIPKALVKNSKVRSVRQWTKEEAEQWSVEKYREKYLGITAFGLTENRQLLTEIEETELGDKIEEQVKDDKFIPDEINTRTPIAKLGIIYSAINSNKYLSFSFKNEKTIVKPVRVTKSELIAFCYIKNRERTFEIYEIKDIQIKDSYYTLRVAGPTIGIERIKNAVNTAINYHKLIRMKYTRSAWSSMLVDQETGELIVNNIEAEESIRTINDVQMSNNALAQEHIEQYNLNENYITAYCNKREEQRTFRFDRIGEIEILDL